MLKIIHSIPIPHTHFVNKNGDFRLCGENWSVEIFKSRLRVIGTEKWNRVLTVLVEYPGTRIPGTALMSVHSHHVQHRAAKQEKNCFADQFA